MKSIVFDNAGTIIKRVNALKHTSTQNIIFETNTIGMVDQMCEGVMLVFQTPTKKLIQQDRTIYDFLKNNPEQYEISYSTKNYTKQEVSKALKHDTITFRDIKQATSQLINKYEIDICSGSAVIIDMKKRKIEYVYTAGGIIYPETTKLFKKLNQKQYNLYIASGDNKESLVKIAKKLEIPEENVYHTCNSHCKENVVKTLQEKNDHVFMVGNNTNDEKAIKKADTGILTIQQKEKLPQHLYESSDYVIESIYDVLKIVDEV